MRKKMMKVLAILALIAIISNFGIPGIVYPVITFAANTATDYNFKDELEKDRTGIGFTWTAATRTLTITAIKNKDAAIFLPEDATVDIQGNAENTIKYICGEGKLTITGNDTAVLNIVSGYLYGEECELYKEISPSTAHYTYASIYAKDKITIRGGNININPNYNMQTTYYKYGITTFNNVAVSMYGGNLTIQGNCTIGIDASVYMYNGSLDTIGQQAGINGNLVLRDGNVSSRTKVGFGIYGTSTIKGGTITAEGHPQTYSLTYNGKYFGAFYGVPDIDPTFSCKLLYNEKGTNLEQCIETDITDIYNVYSSRLLKIYPYNPTTSISVSTEKDYICVDEKANFVANVEPQNSTDSVTWSSSNENIATVSENGEVTGIASGTATITAKSGEYSASKDINVICGVTLDSNGVEDIETETLYTDTKGKLESLPTLTTEGKDFIKWIDSEGNEVTTDTIFTQNTTIYAQWRDRTIFVSEQKNSVKYKEEATIAYDVTSNFPGIYKIKVNNLPEGVTLNSDEINFIEINNGEYKGTLELNVSNIVESGTIYNLRITINDIIVSNNFSLKIDKIVSTFEKPEAKTLEYTGTAQNLIIEGATADGVFEYSTNGTNYSTEIPKGINAGEYTIYYRVKGDNNHYDSEVATIISVINKIDSKVETQPKGKTLQYNSTRQGLAIAGTANGGIIEYSLDGETFSTNIPTGINAGEYTIYYRVKGDINHYNSKISTIVAVINKVDSKINIQPKGKALVYNSLEQALIEAGTTNDGKIQYSLDGKTFTTDIPRGMDVGTYKIYYKILGDKNHYDSEIAAIVAVINKADSVMEKQPKGKTLEYNSLEQKLIEEGITNDGEILYSLDGKTFTTDIPQATEVGSYRIYYKVVGDSNHYDSEVNVTIAVINKIDSIIEIQPKGKTLVYNSISQELIEVGTTQDGEIQYSMDGQIFTTEIPTATDAGTYIIYYKVVGDNNHYDGAVSATVATINKIDSIIQTHPKEKTLVYNSVAQELIEAGTTQDGQIQYSIDGQTFSTEIPTGIEAGEYTIYYKVKGDNNHYDSELSTIVAVINKIDSTIITLPNGRMLAYNSLEQELIEAGTTNDGIIEYSLDGENYSEQIPKATKVGAYKVYYRIKGDKNHLDFDDKSYVEAKIKIAFTDVEPTDWYYTAVEYNFANGMILGLNETTFAPNQTLTRAMLVTILHRMEGMPYVPGLSVFPDVQNTNSYYYLAVKWATQNGIVSGYNNGNFGPNDPITREQLAVILNNYCRYKGQYKTVNADLSKYADSDKISDYAKWGMNWAVGSGVITGNANDGTLNPQGTATRAEVASMLYKYCLNFK